MLYYGIPQSYGRITQTNCEKKSRQDVKGFVGKDDLRVNVGGKGRLGMAACKDLPLTRDGGRFYDVKVSNLS